MELFLYNSVQLLLIAAPNLLCAIFILYGKKRFYFLQ